ncbi:hypothetical protein HC928_12725 [bacterium]|nr:hypothetical protein [bacterium]
MDKDLLHLLLIRMKVSPAATPIYWDGDLLVSFLCWVVQEQPEIPQLAFVVLGSVPNAQQEAKRFVDTAMMQLLQLHVLEDIVQQFQMMVHPEFLIQCIIDLAQEILQRTPLFVMPMVRSPTQPFFATLLSQDVNVQI